jgi:hypothetical protein
MLKGGSSNNGKESLEQLNTNIIASYVFTAFLAILIIFVIKSLIN